MVTGSEEEVRKDFRGNIFTPQVSNSVRTHSSQMRT